MAEGQKAKLPPAVELGRCLRCQHWPSDDPNPEAVEREFQMHFRPGRGANLDLWTAWIARILNAGGGIRGALLMSELFRLAEPSPNHKVSLTRAGYGQWGFLVTEPPARPLCCGAPTLGEGSWCPWHPRVVYARPQPLPPLTA